MAKDSGLGKTFGEMVRRAAAGLPPVPRTEHTALLQHYCHSCGQITDHEFAYEQGTMEYYRCGNPNCNLLHGYAVR